MTVSLIITQANDKTASNNARKSSNHQLPDLLSLCLRGTRIEIDRDTLLTLPESILVVMFPQGFILDSEKEDSFCYVDFSLDCLNYILAFYQKAQKLSHYANEFTQDVYLAHAVASGIPLNPLLTKQGVIVLREELEFFLVVVTSKTSLKEQQQANNNSNIMLSNLKQKSSELLVRQDLVFEALLKTIYKEKDPESAAEFHLIDMLCTAGFTRQDHWDYRATEPNKTCITSLSLVTIYQKDTLHIGQKLMMFWRKPERKCWWTNSIVHIDGETVKLWCRRTWTLELVLL